jgi:hypothetical protein
VSRGPAILLAAIEPGLMARRGRRVHANEAGEFIGCDPEQRRYSARE